MSIKGYYSIWGQTSKRLALAIVSISGLVSSVPALAAQITVASPVNGTTIAAPIWVRAHNVGCDGLPPTAFGYSVDGSSTLVRGVTKYDVDVIKVPMSAGTHTIHFKSWTTNGICPVVSTTFKIGSGGSSSGGGNTSGGGSGSAPSGSIPANAIGSASLDGKHWAFEKDAGTPGSGRGSTVYPARTPAYDNAREFYMTYARRGGVRWHVSFAKDAGVTHFVYDTYVYITNPDQVGNIELDMNQVMSNGQTVIYGTQCSAYSKTWEYTVYSGGFHWRTSNIGCNPRNWAAKTWHHVQIASHRDSSGNVTYDWVNLDGAHHVFSNAKGHSAHNLGWARGNLLINFQLDGFNTGSGSITSYIHKMTIFRW